MTDAKAEALRTLVVYKDWPYGISMSPEDRGALLAHIADLEARAERAEKEYRHLENFAQERGVLDGHATTEATRRAETAEAALARAREALEFYAREWQPNGDGDATTPGLSRSWHEPSDELWHDAGFRARQALAASPERTAYLPPLNTLKGKQYFAKDSDDQWYYLNHASTWQTCPPVSASPEPQRATDDLRAENEQLRHDIERATETNSGLATENERLRALLREVKDAFGGMIGRAGVLRWGLDLSGPAQDLALAKTVYARIDAATKEG